jgi:hypothetical protein
VTGHARFDDAVLQAAWPQEYHVHDRGTEYRFLADGASYQVPFRSLIPCEGSPTNLLVAGRCISADHDALASCRVMAPCMAMGEAAGTAAAMAAELDAPDVAAVDVATLRDDLEKNGAVLA